MTGTFTPDGEWISGELRHADPHLCGWLAGPQVAPRLAVLPRFRATQAAGASTGPDGDARNATASSTGVEIEGAAR